MTNSDARRRHAEAVTATALAVADGIADPLRPDAASDRADLAELLGAIGETWTAALDSSGTRAERLRWSRVCVVAQRIAERLAKEVDEETAETAGRRRVVVPIRRG